MTSFALPFVLARQRQAGTCHSAPFSGLILVPWVAALGLAGQMRRYLPAQRLPALRLPALRLPASACPRRFAPDASGVSTTTLQVGASIGAAGPGSVSLALSCTHSPDHAFAVTALALGSWVLPRRPAPSPPASRPSARSSGARVCVSGQGPHRGHRQTRALGQLRPEAPAQDGRLPRGCRKSGQAVRAPGRSRGVRVGASRERGRGHRQRDRAGACGAVAAGGWRGGRGPRRRPCLDGERMRAKARPVWVRLRFAQPRPGRAADHEPVDGPWQDLAVLSHLVMPRVVAGDTPSAKR